MLSFSEADTDVVGRSESVAELVASFVVGVVTTAPIVDVVMAGRTAGNVVVLRDTLLVGWDCGRGKTTATATATMSATITEMSTMMRLRRRF